MARMIFVRVGVFKEAMSGRFGCVVVMMQIYDKITVNPTARTMLGF